MRSLPGLLVHIGYHKTGSTWLQERIFREPLGYYSPWDRRLAFSTFILVNPLTFSSAEAYDIYREGIEEAYQRSLVPVISQEALSGNRSRPLYTAKSTADHLHQTFPEAKIFVAVREQISMVASWYKHHVMAGNRLGIDEYLAAPEAGFDPMFPLDHLEYHNLIGYYQKLFGRERVLVLPYEQLRDSGPSFVSSINRFVGLDPVSEVPEEVENRGYSAMSVELRRRINPWVVSTPRTRTRRAYLDRLALKALYRIDRLTPPQWQRGFDDRLRRSIRSRLAGHYRRSNQLLAELTDLDLGALGYDC